MGNNYENFDLGPAIRMGGRNRGGNRSGDCCEWNNGTAAANNGGYECEQCNGTAYTNGRSQCECKVATVTANNGSALTMNSCSECIEGETHVYYESCDGAKEVTISSECHNEDSMGRTMDVTMTLCNVCPGRRCAVGVHLTEMDENGNEYERGFRSLTVPAHNYSTNRDIELPSLRFIMPEDVSVVDEGCRRHFVVRTTNHYMEEATNCRRK